MQEVFPCQTYYTRNQKFWAFWDITADSWQYTKVTSRTMGTSYKSKLKFQFFRDSLTVSTYKAYKLQCKMGTFNYTFYILVLTIVCCITVFCLHFLLASFSYGRIQSSMTTLLTHTVAHSTKPSFRPKTNNQPLKKSLSLALS